MSPGIVKEKLTSFYLREEIHHLKGLIQEVSDVLDFNIENRETDIEKIITGSL